MSPYHHIDNAGEKTLLTLATLATAAGGADRVRDTIHLLAGLWGDFAGVLVSLLTVTWWALKVADTLLAKWRARRAPLIGGPLGTEARDPKTLFRE